MTPASCRRAWCERVVFTAAETRSFERAELMLNKIGDAAVSAPTIRRVVGDVGGELAARRDAEPGGAAGLAQRPEEPPELAVVECDGGRVRTRQPGHGRGVHLSGEGWRETKNACLIRASRKTFTEIRSRNHRHASAIRSTWRKWRKPRRCRWPAPRAASPPSEQSSAERADAWPMARRAAGRLASEATGANGGQQHEDLARFRPANGP